MSFVHYGLKFWRNLHFRLTLKKRFVNHLVYGMVIGSNSLLRLLKVFDALFDSYIITSLFSSCTLKLEIFKMVMLRKIFTDN